MKPSPKVLTSTVKRPQSVRVRSIKSGNQPLNKMAEQPPKIAPKSKLIVEFAVPQKIVRTSNQAFLWENLVLENTQLKNTINQLRNQNQQLLEDNENLKTQIKRMHKSNSQQVKYNDEEANRLKLKNRELEKALSQLRLRESELKHKIQEHEEQKRMTKEQFMVVKSKHSKLGEMRVKMEEVKEENRLLNQKTSENLNQIFQEKFPHYHAFIFKVLNVFKRLEKIQRSPPTQRFRKLIKFLTSNLVNIGKTLYNYVVDWLKYAFFGKLAYHPDNKDLIEAMLDKWKSSSNLTQELHIKTKQLSLLQKHYVKMVQTHERDEERIRKLQINNENILFRNQKLQQTFDNTSHDFAYFLLSKIKRYEQQMKQYPEFQDPQYKDLGMLVHPQYMKLKQATELLKKSAEVNRNLRQQLKEERLKQKQQQLNQDLEYLKSGIEERKQRRSVVILKKNVYGYWIDPNFKASTKITKKSYQKYLHKATQTLNQTELQKRLFFSLIILKAQLRSVALKFDPYVKLEYSSHSYKTSTKSGKQPVWNESFVFQMRQTRLNLVIFDKQKLGRDTIFGEASADLSKVFIENSTEQIKMELRLEDKKGQFIGKLWIGIWMLEEQEVIHIREVQGNLTIQKDILSQMDPYCIFKIDNKVADQTSVCRKGGLKPIWREQFMLFIGPESRVLGIDVKDEDVLVDDDIGAGSAKIEGIPQQEQEMTVDLYDDDKNMGFVRFKIYRRKYINSSIKKKQPLLIALNIKQQRFFVIENTKLVISRVLAPSIYYEVQYSNITKQSGVNKGKQLFFPQPYIFKITSSAKIGLAVKEKVAIGDDALLMNVDYDASENIGGNYQDLETVQNIANNVQFSTKFRLVGQVQALYLREIRVEPIKQFKQEGFIEVKLQNQTSKYKLQEDKGDLVIRFQEEQQLYSLNQFKAAHFNLMSKDASIANGTIPKSNILENLLTEISVILKDKSGLLYAKLTIVAARHKFVNILNTKVKKQRLNLGHREYFSLLAHKAILTRDTELFGSMKCYLFLQYLKKCRTKVSKGKQPIWNESFIFYIQPQARLEFRVMDEQSVGNDDLVGSGNLDIKDILDKGEESIISNLIFQQQVCGHAFFSIASIPLQTVIRIEVVRAEVYQDTDWIGKIDPYALIMHDGKEYYKTQVLNQKGQNPQWKMQVEVQVTNPQGCVEILLFDDDLIGKDELGVAIFEVSKFTEIIDEISAPLMKDDKQFGVVYLTAACNKFVGRPALPRELDVPRMFQNLDLVKFTIVDLKGKQPLEFLIKYSYPFDKEAHPSSKSTNCVYNKQEYLNISSEIKLQLYKHNLLKGYQFKYNIDINPSRKQSFVLQSVPVTNSKQKQLGVLRCAIQKVYKCWVLYVKKYEFKLRQNLKDVALVLRTSVDRYQLHPQKEEAKQQTQFWIYAAEDEIEIEVKEKSTFSEQMVGRLRVNIDLINIQSLKWRDFEIPNVGKVSLLCAKKLYEHPFNYTCLPSSTKSKARVLRLNKYTTKESKKQISLRDTINNTRIRIDGELNQLVSEEQRLQFDSGEWNIEGEKRVSMDKKSSVFLVENKRRVGVATCEPIQGCQQCVKCVVKDLRVQTTSNDPHLTLKIGKREFTSQTRIGQYWYFQTLTLFVPKNQRLVLHVMPQSQKHLESQLQYKEQCYFQNQIIQQNFKAYYSIEASPCQATPLAQKQAESAQTSLHIFSIESIEISTPLRVLGSGYCYIIYNDRRHVFNVVNGVSSYLIPQSCSFQRADRGYIQFLIETKLQGKCRINVQHLIELSSKVQQEAEGQITANGLNVGTIKIKFKCIERMNYRQLQIKNVVVASQFKNPSLVLKCGAENTSLPLDQADGLYSVPGKINVFSQHPVHLSIEENDILLGQSQLQESTFSSLIGTDQVNGLIQGRLRPMTNIQTYNTQSLMSKQMPLGKVLCQLSIKDIFIEGSKSITFYFAIYLQQEALYSPYYQTNQYYHSECLFSTILEHNNKTRIQLWKREMSNQKLLGQAVLNTSNPGQQTLVFTSRNTTAAVGLIAVTDIVKGQYLRITKIAASKLTDTQLLVNMNPYVLIHFDNLSYRSSVGVGKDNVSWKINMIVPKKDGKMRVAVMDRDLKYDDEVGDAKMEVKDLIKKKDWVLHDKKAESGSLVINSEQVQAQQRVEGVRVKRGPVESKSRYLRVRLQKITGISKKLKMPSPYMKVTVENQTKYQYPISKSQQELVFNTIIEQSQENNSSLAVQLCSDASKSQKVHCSAVIQISQTAPTSVMLFNQKKEPVATLHFGTSRVFNQVCRIRQVHLFTPGRDTSFRKSFSISTRNQVYESREVNSNDNMVGFYDFIDVSSKSHIKFDVRVNSRTIGHSTLDCLQSGTYTSIITNQKGSYKGVLSVVTQNTVFEGQTLSRVETSAKRWISLKIIRAKSTRDVELLSKMDLYCQLQSWDKQYRTKVLDNIGMSAEWNEEMTIPQGKQYTLGLWDSQVLKDRIVGSAPIDFANYPQQKQNTIPISFQGKNVGDVTFTYKYLPNYIRLNNFRSLSKREIQRIDVRSSQTLLFSMQRPSQLHKLNIEVPFISDSLLLKVDDIEATLNMETLKTNEVYSVVLEEAFYFEYRLFVSE